MKPIRLLCLFICAAAMIGCGGSGGAGSSNRGPTDQTRQRVDDTQKATALALSCSGIQTPGQAGMINGPAMDHGGMPMIGGFIRHFRPPTGEPPKPRRHSTRGDEPPSTDPGQGGGGTDPNDPPIEQPSFYYDEWLGLWVQVDKSDTAFSMLFYTDEAKQHPAGHMTSTWPQDWTTYPVVWSSDYEFTAGTMSGSHGSYVSRMDSETSGSMTYDSTWDGNRYQGQSIWNEEGSAWSSRSESSDGFWSTDSGDFHSNGSGTTTSENSLGYRTRFTWNSDGSGNGRLEGPDSGLPATIIWDAMGDGTITYADGTVDEFHWWRMLDGDGTVKPD